MQCFVHFCWLPLQSYLPLCSFLLVQVQHGSGRKLKETPNNVNFESNKQNLSISRSKEEALRHFHVSDDRSALTFRLMKVRGLPEWANTSCVSIETVIEVNSIVILNSTGSYRL